MVKKQLNGKGKGWHKEIPRHQRVAREAWAKKTAKNITRLSPINPSKLSAGNISKTLTVKYIGEDFWGNKLYQNVKTNSIYADVDGKLHTYTAEGEPDLLLNNPIEYISDNKNLGGNREIIDKLGVPFSQTNNPEDFYPDDDTVTDAVHHIYDYETEWNDLGSDEMDKIVDYLINDHYSITKYDYRPHQLTKKDYSPKIENTGDRLDIGKIKWKRIK